MSSIIRHTERRKSIISCLTRQRNKILIIFLCLIALNTFRYKGIADPDDARPPSLDLAKEEELNDSNDARVTSGRAREFSKIQKMAKEEQLNVIIFYPDDWRHDDLGDLSPILETPFFTRLAKEGIRFSQNAVTTSICWISRATLFTGQYASRHASAYLFRPNFARGDAWKNTWPYRLQEAGYFVGHIGKWQYRELGYKISDLFNWTRHLEKGSFWYGQVHIIDRCKETALQFLSERPDGKPFALTIAFYPPKGAVDPEKATNESKKFYEDKYISQSIQLMML